MAGSLILPHTPVSKLVSSASVSNFDTKCNMATKGGDSQERTYHWDHGSGQVHICYTRGNHTPHSIALGRQVECVQRVVDHYQEGSSPLLGAGLTQACSFCSVQVSQWIYHDPISVSAVSMLMSVLCRLGSNCLRLMSRLPPGSLSGCCKARTCPGTASCQTWSILSS